MKTTIETINGKQYTVVWNNEFDAKASEANPLDVGGYDEAMNLSGGVLALHQMNECFAVALPALPRNPKPEDAKLLYRYMSEGLRPVGPAEYAEDNRDACPIFIDIRELTHATDSEGNRIEIALED